MKKKILSALSIMLFISIGISVVALGAANEKSKQASTTLMKSSYYAVTDSLKNEVGSYKLEGEVTSLVSTKVQFIAFKKMDVATTTQAQSWIKSPDDPELTMDRYDFTGGFFHVGYLQPYGEFSGQGGIAKVTCYVK